MRLHQVDQTLGDAVGFAGEQNVLLPFQLAAERRARAAGLRPQGAFDLASLPQATRPYQTWATPSVMTRLIFFLTLAAAGLAMMVAPYFLMALRGPLRVRALVWVR